MEKRVTILVGPSGCGKSTWIKEQEKCGEWEVCSADHYFLQADGSYQFNPSLLGKAHGACLEKFKQCLACGLFTIFVDNTSTREWERKEYVELAKRAGYEVWLKVFQVDPEVCAARNLHGVPVESVRKMAERIDVPEGFYPV
jgi:predicted kinase